MSTFVYLMHRETFSSGASIGVIDRFEEYAREELASRWAAEWWETDTLRAAGLIGETVGVELAVVRDPDDIPSQAWSSAEKWNGTIY